MSTKTVFLPRAKVSDDFMMVLQVTAAKRRFEVTDLLREALEKHPDVQREMEALGVESVEITRGGDRRNYSRNAR